MRAPHSAPATRQPQSTHCHGAQVTETAPASQPACSLSRQCGGGAATAHLVPPDPGILAALSSHGTALRFTGSAVPAAVNRPLLGYMAPPFQPPRLTA